MKKFFIFFLFFFISINVYCKNVVTSIYPIYTIIKNILPANYKISYVIPIGANPHVFEPSPKLALLIKKADIFIGVEKEFDGWIEKFINNKCKVLYLQKNKLNPHIWLSPTIMMQKIKIIFNFFCSYYKEDCTFIEKNSQKYLKLINSEYNKLKNKTAKLKNKNFIQFHPAWNYFAKDFGLSIIGTLSKEHGNNISLKHYILLLNKAKKNGVKFILVGLKTDNNILNSFSKKISGSIINLKLFGNKNMEYLDLIKFNVNRIINRCDN